MSLQHTGGGGRIKAVQVPARPEHAGPASVPVADRQQVEPGLWLEQAYDRPIGQIAQAGGELTQDRRQQARAFIRRRYNPLLTRVYDPTILAHYGDS